MEQAQVDIAIIGAGPGGYVAAIRAAQLGKKVCVIEREHIGGICLNWGCIPTKVLLKNAEVLTEIQKAKTFGIKVGTPEIDFTTFIKRSRDTATRLSKGVAYLFKKYEITVLDGSGSLQDNNRVAVEKDGKQTHEVKADHIILATGARPRTLPSIKIDYNQIITSKEAMILESIPKSMIIIGAGAIGVEFAQIYNALGTEITILEALPKILPIEDEEVSDTLAKSFKKRKIAIHTNAMVQSASVKNDKEVAVTFKVNEEEQTIRAEKVLVSIGVQGNTEGLNLDKIGVKTERSFVVVDKKTLQTSVEGIYAIGDVNGPPLLAHMASAEGIYLVEKLAGHKVEPINYDLTPGCTYCSPQVASVGMTEKQARDAGKQIKVGKFFFRANGKALALGEYDGFVKAIIDEKYGEILGVHMIGPEVTELLGEVCVAMKNEVTYKDLIKTIHPHPTLSESIMEVMGEPFGESTAT